MSIGLEFTVKLVKMSREVAGVAPCDWLRPRVKDWGTNTPAEADKPEERGRVGGDDEIATPSPERPERLPPVSMGCIGPEMVAARGNRGEKGMLPGVIGGD